MVSLNPTENPTNNHKNNLRPAEYTALESCSPPFRVPTNPIDSMATPPSLGINGISLPGSSTLNKFDVPDDAELVGPNRQALIHKKRFLALLRSFDTRLPRPEITYALGLERGRIFNADELKILGNSKKAVGSCRTTGIQMPALVEFSTRESRSVHKNGLLGCDNKNCPHCSRTRATAHTAEAMDAFQRHVSLGGSVSAVVLTTPLTPSKYAHLSFILIDEARKIIMNGRFSKSWKNLFGSEFHTLRVDEMMMSERGDHAHQHQAFFHKVKPEGTELENARKVYLVWNEAVCRAHAKLSIINPEEWSWVEESVRKNEAAVRFDKLQYEWIPEGIKLIVRPPYEEIITKKTGETRMVVRGGVSFEFMRDGNAFAKYLAKEMAMSGDKISRSTSRDSYSLPGLLEIMPKENWARQAVIRYILLTYKRKMWSWSCKGKMAYNEWLIKQNVVLPLELESEKPTIKYLAVGRIQQVVEHEQSEAGSDFARYMDAAATITLEQSWKDLSGGVFIDVPEDQEIQSKIKEEQQLQWAWFAFEMSERSRKRRH